MPGAELKTAGRSSRRKNSSFQTLGKYAIGTKARLALSCAKSLLWAVDKLKLLQVTKAPASACELDTNTFLRCWPPPCYRLAWGRGAARSLQWGLCPMLKPLHKPVLPCPKQVKQMTLGDGAQHWCIFLAFLLAVLGPVDWMLITGWGKRNGMMACKRSDVL